MDIQLKFPLNFEDKKNDERRKIFRVCRGQQSILIRRRLSDYGRLIYSLVVTRLFASNKRKSAHIYGSTYCPSFRCLTTKYNLNISLGWPYNYGYIVCHIAACGTREQYNSRISISIYDVKDWRNIVA